MIRYKKYQVTGEDSPLKGLWYARPVIEETFDIEKLAKHMSNHNTPLFEWCHQGSTGRHGFLHQRIDSGRQERETG